MSYSEIFNIGYLKTYSKFNEEIFLSVTPNFYSGPGIQRDGLTAPRMIDPHTVQQVWGANVGAYNNANLPETTNPYIQRAGTWTIFQHVNNFIENYGSDYTIIGVQSCGDLTMNPWHVALIKHTDNKNSLCRLNIPGSFIEPIEDRSYRCLVKWNEDMITGIHDMRYEFIDLKFFDLDRQEIMTKIIDDDYKSRMADWFKKSKVNPENITDNIEFALSGKPIIQKGSDIIIANVIDSFQDVRHIFNLPSVDAYTFRTNGRIGKINFGEYVLYNNLNVRRAAIHSSIIVTIEDPQIDVRVKWNELKCVLDERHFKEVYSSPTKRGEYRKYDQKSVEIFFPYNVYPFGVIGGGKSGGLACLAAGGLSGRVGTTLEGITRIMYDFFGCEDALVLDEGYDTFHIINPNEKKNKTDNDDLKYNNEQMLEQIASFTLKRIQDDDTDCKLTTNDYHFKNDFKEWPLNKPLIKKLDDYAKSKGITPKSLSELEIIAVEPKRSQIRSVIIFAKKQGKRAEIGQR